MEGSGLSHRRQKDKLSVVHLEACHFSEVFYNSFSCQSELEICCSPAVLLLVCKDLEVGLPLLLAYRGNCRKGLLSSSSVPLGW